MEITHRKAGSVTVIDLSGRLIYGEAANSLLETSKGLLARGENQLLFNLKEVSYLDSSGLGTLVKCFNAARVQKAGMKLVHLPGSIRELLRITNLLTFFEIFDDEAAALNSFN